MSQLNQINAFLLSSCIFSGVLQAESSLPRGCEVTGFAYENHNLLLNETGTQAYYLIQNRSDATIELEHKASGDSFMSPPLHATFDSMSWGAFASDVKYLNFTCYKHINDKALPIDCGEVLEVCQYPRVRFALSNMGNYWVAFNKSQNDIIQESVAKGIYLKW